MRIVGHYPFLFSKMSLLIALENINRGQTSNKIPPP